MARRNAGGLDIEIACEVRSTGRMKPRHMTDWSVVSSAASRILFNASARGFSETFNPALECHEPLKNLAKEFGYKLVKVNK
jgi:hypothetical protein